MAKVNSRAEHDLAIISDPDHYTATIFLGQGRFATVCYIDSLEEARSQAARLVASYPNGRDAMIYATKDGVSAHVENVRRKKA